MTAPWQSSEQLDALIPEPAPRNGYMSDDEPPLIGEPVGNIPRSQPSARPLRAVSDGLEVLSWWQILEEPAEPPPMHPPGFPKVGATVLAGPPKIGKTLLATQCALEAGRSTLVIEEGSLAGLSYRLRRQAAALGIAEPDIVAIHRQRIRLDDRQSVARLRAHIAKRRPTVVVLDPLNRLHGADENRPTQMTPVMDVLSAIAYDFACAVLCVHHLAKPSAERKGDVWDRFRGATSIRSGTDCNLILDGSGTAVRLVGEYRDAEPLSEYMKLDRETLTFGPAEAPKGAGKIHPDELLAFVDEQTNVTAREVMVRFTVSKPTALAALDAADELDRFEGTRGQMTYFRGTVK